MRAVKVFSKNIDEVETEYHEALRRQTAELQMKRQENWKRRQDLVQQTESKALGMKDELMKETLRSKAYWYSSFDIY